MPFPDWTQPPCIILGLETQIGLGLVRELGRAGVPVIGITHDAKAIGLSSKYLARKLVVEQPRSPELLTAIRALGEEFGPCCLLTVSEANLSWLAQSGDVFGKVRPVAPTAEKLATVLDKQRTLTAARAVGITVPDTVEVHSIQEAGALAENFKFPAVLKWKDPNTVARKLSAHSLELLKAEYVYTAAQFLEAARRYAPLGEWPIVQAYCPGVGLGQFFYMHRGEPVRRFQHIRVAEWPPEGGFSSVCDSVSLDQHQALQQKSVDLLRHIGWEGVAMVEYRWDPATDQAVLMEINGRYWGSYPLAVHCHADFALISYLLENGMAVPALPAVLDGYRCRMMSTEIKRLVRILFQRELIVDRSFKVRRWAETVQFVANFFRAKVRYYVWDIDDPKPFWVDAENLLRKVLGR